MINLILLAAGKGIRARSANLNYPKQLYRLAGIPIFIRIINIFQSISEIDSIILTVIKGEEKNFKNILKKYNISNVKIVSGGDTRQESVCNALQYVTTKNVVIHEAARPFINKDFVEAIIKNKNNNVVPVLDIPFTVYNKKEKHYPNRDDVVNIQLPQKFNTKLLKEVHSKYEGLNFTDDSSLFALNYGADSITYIDGLEENIKITNRIDVLVGEAIYAEISNNSGW